MNCADSNTYSLQGSCLVLCQWGGANERWRGNKVPRHPGLNVVIFIIAFFIVIAVLHIAGIVPTKNNLVEQALNLYSFQWAASKKGRWLRILPAVVTNRYGG